MQDVVDEEVDYQGKGLVVVIWVVGGVVVVDWCWQFFVVDQCDQCVGGCGQVVGIIVGVELWGQVFLDYVIGDCIGNCVFQFVFWFDVYLVIIFGYYQQYVVVYVFVVDLLLFEYVLGVLFD